MYSKVINQQKIIFTCIAEGVGVGTDATTSGEFNGVLSMSLGDNESKLSMPLSCSIDMYAVGTKKQKEKPLDIVHIHSW